MKKILVTGGAGFIGSHMAEHYAKESNEVIVLDNLCRAELLKKDNKNAKYNWDFLSKFDNVKLIKGDVRDLNLVMETTKDVDSIIHTAAQTAVTTSIKEPEPDFTTNAIGTFNVLEAARKNNVKSVLYCSTNKVYGENVNTIGVQENEKRYSFSEDLKDGIKESFDIDLCEHTPYGCSKLTGDIYAQDFGHLYGIKTGVFRMSCIYGTRQFGVEDQGWVAWFTIATVTGKPITIYGDGKQVRDILYIKDLVNMFDTFMSSSLKKGVFNIGGGPDSTISLLELLDILEDLTGKRSKLSFDDWRPSDQKVYISNISKVKKELDWEPKVKPQEGMKQLVDWAESNKSMF